MTNKEQFKIYASLLNYAQYRDRYETFAAMARQGADVELLLLHGAHPPAANYPDSFHQLNLPEGTSIFNRGPHIRALLQDAKTTGRRVVIHDTFFGQFMWYYRRRYTFARRDNVRVVLSLFNPDPGYLLGGHFRCAPSPDYRFKNLIWLLKGYARLVAIQGLSCQFSDGITGNSRQIVDDVHRFFRIPHNRLRFIPSEINPGFFTPGPSQRKDLNLPDSGPVILYVGNFERRKGIDIFLKTVAELARRLPQTRAILVGKYIEPCSDWIERLCQSPELSGRVEIRNSVPPETLRLYYRSADLLFFPTRHEGSPRVVKEAMACGCPVVGPPIPPLHAVDPEGSVILYTSGYDPIDCSSTIQEMLKPEVRKLRVQGGLELIREYTPQKVAQLYLDFYDYLF